MSSEGVIPIPAIGGSQGIPYYIGMASLESRFRAIQREYPFHSSLINFGRAIKGQNLSQRRLFYYFDRFVERDDYSKEDKKEVRFLYCQKTPTQEQGYFADKGSIMGLTLPALT